MDKPHTKITPYTDELISKPSAHLRMELGQDEDGLKLTHNGRVLVECYLTREGMAAGAYMAEALGVTIPSLSQKVPVRVSTGVLYRAVSIASLDFGNTVSKVLLRRWLEEAKHQRGGSSDAN